MKHYNPFEEMTFSYECCFLCGIFLDDSIRTVEHVFPKWLQHEFNLWDKTLILLNKSQIPYRSLTVPCCKPCNNKYLNMIEKRIKAAVKGGYEEFIKLDEEVIFKWLVKLSYGVLFKELSLRLEIQNKDSRNIIEPDQLAKFRMLFTFLQTIRFETEFVNRTPWSILIFKINNSGTNIRYNGQDLIMSNNYFLQLNNIGIISHLQDNGLMKEFFMEHRSEFTDIVLHPIQFRELCAEFQYKSVLLKKLPYYTINLPERENGKMQILSFDLYGHDLFDDWKTEEFCHLLEYYWKPWDYKFDDIYFDNDHYLSFLRNEDGSVKSFFSNS